MGRPEAVLRALGRPVRAARARRAAHGSTTPELVAASDSVCTGLQLVNFLQDVPRDLELGRIYLPAEDRRTFGDPALDRPSDELRALLRFEARACRGAARARATSCAQRIGGPARPRGRAVRARRPRRARRARSGGLGHLHAPPEAVARAPRARGRARPRAMSVRGGLRRGRRITRREAKNFAYGIMVLPRAKRRAIAAIYAFAREVDDVADGDLPPDEKRAELEALRAALDETPRSRDARRARRRARALRHPARRALGARRRRPAGPRADARTRRSTSCAATARRSRAPSASRASPVYGSDDVERAKTLGIALQLINIMRDVDEDRRLGRVYLPQDELARFRRARSSLVVAGVAGADGVPGRACARRISPRGCACSTRSTAAARSASATFAGLYRGQLDRMEANGFDVFGASCRLSTPREARRRRAGAPAVKVAVVGGGLAGLAAALDLVDAGADVTVLRGAADARRRGADAAGARGRSGAAARQRPAHRARLLHRVPRASSSGSARAARTCARGSRCRCSTRTDGVATIAPSLPVAAARTRTCRFATGCASRSPRCAALREAAAAARHSATCCAGSGRANAAIDRFWDVFIRPALNLRCRRGRRRQPGLFTVRTALLGPRANTDLVLPLKPLGWMHGDAAGRVLGDRVRLERARRVARRARRRRDRRRRAAARERAPARGAGAGARGLADRQRPPLVRPAAARPRRSPRCSARTRTGSSTAAR